MDLLLKVNGYLYYPILIIILIGAGLYFTVRTGFLQISMFGESLRVLREKPHEGEVSSFQALMVSTASRVGTGNIVGVAQAIASAATAPCSGCGSSP